MTKRPSNVIMYCATKTSQQKGVSLSMNDYITEIGKLQAKKIDGLRLADSYERLGTWPNEISEIRSAGDKCCRWLSRAAQVRGCGTYLLFGVYSSGISSLIEANFCKQRLCPSCQLRRSLRVYSDICKVLDYVDTHDDDHNYFFLTLTVRNVIGADLSDCIKMMSVGWNRMCNRRDVKGLVRGTIKTLEVTCNQDTGYHPHYHIILALPKRYGPRDVMCYWSIERWARTWGRSLGVNYSPSVSIHMIRGGISKGVKETAKYAVKPSDYLSTFDHVSMDRKVHDLTIGLHGKRLLSYGGIFAEARRQLGIDDNLDDRLCDDICREDVLTALVTARWGFGPRCYDIEVEEC